MNLEVKKLDPAAKLPERAYDKDAGYDVFALEDKTIHPKTTEKIRTGIAMQPPEGWYGSIEERSSIGSKGISKQGGVCDETYTGEYVVCLTNNAYRKFCPISKAFMPTAYQIKKGDKIAQVVFMQYGNFEIKEVEEFDSVNRTNSARGDSGFGSSGT